MKEPIPGILLHCSFESEDICGYTSHDLTGDKTVFQQRHGAPITDHTTHTDMGANKTSGKQNYD